MILYIFDRQSKHRGVFKCAHLKCDFCQKELNRDVNRIHSERQYCSHSCKMKGISPSQEMRVKIAKALTGIKRSDETRKKMSENNAMNNPIARLKVSTTRSSKIALGLISPTVKGNYGKYMSIKTGSVEHYDSLLELKRMITLDNDEFVLFWTKKHGIRIPYVFEGQRKNYIPDFYIKRNENNTIEEVKGWEGEPKLPAKLEALRAYCTLNKFKVSYLNKDSVDLLFLNQGDK